MELADVVRKIVKRKAWYFNNSDSGENLRNTFRKKDSFKGKLVKLYIQFKQG